MNRYSFLFLIAIWLPSAQAQTLPFPEEINPVAGTIFDDTIVPEIEIEIDPDSLTKLFLPENLESYHEYPAKFIFKTPTMSDTIEQIGFRLRGNTSRQSKKKSYKISFNTFHKGRKYYGLEKMNINGEHNDPSIIRSKLCWDQFKFLNVPSSRANHVKLFINKKYYGLYINVEHIDENFLKTRFSNNSGNLYKCLWPADLTYRGSDPELYKFMQGDRRTYDLKTNKSLDDYSGFAHFITVLNQSNAQTFEQEIQKVFNVDGYLRMLAVDVATGNWDNHWYLKNNFYLYHNPQNDLFEFIPYDYDNTFGIDWFNINWGNRTIYNWGHPSEPRPLATRILDVPRFKDRFSFYLNLLLEQSYNNSVLDPKIDFTHQLITAAAEADKERTLDYGFTISDFHKSYDEALSLHVKYGIKPFIWTRVTTAKAELILNDIAPIVYNVRATHSGGSTQILAQIMDDNEGLSVDVLWSINNILQPKVELYDDGMHNDGAAGDFVYGGALNLAGQSGRLAFYLDITDSKAQHTFAPVDAPQNSFILHIGQPAPRVVINEFLAKNDAVNSDASGNFADWIELFNADTIPHNLNGFFLSDNPENAIKWALPDTVLNPGEFLLLWCDSDPEKGKLHTNFKLSAKGEFISLAQKSATQVTILDSLSFGKQKADISYGRSEDGSQSWKYFNTPTPNGSNHNPSSILEENTLLNKLTLYQNYPNPFNPTTKVKFTLVNPAEVTLAVYNMLGQRIKSVIKRKMHSAGAHFVLIDMSGFSSGIYLYRVEVSGQQLSRKMLYVR